MVNVIAVFRQGINAVCMGLLVFANTEIGNPYEKAMETTAGIAALALLVFGEKVGRMPSTSSCFCRIKKTPFGVRNECEYMPTVSCLSIV